MINLTNRELIRYLLLILLGLIFFKVIVYFETVIVVFALAAVLAFLLTYPVRWLQHFMPHTIAVIVVFLILIIIVFIFTVTIGFALLSQGQQLINELPGIIDQVIFLGRQIERFLDRWNLQIDLEAIEGFVRNQILSGITISLAILSELLTQFVNLILIAVVAFFMLLDRGRLWSFILQQFPPPLRNKLSIAIQRNFLGFFWGRLLLSAFFGISAFVIFVLFRIPYALVLAAIAGVFDLIPAIGATLGITIVALIVLPQGIWLSITVLAICVILQQVEENLLMPRIMQGSLDMNPVVMFFALLVGARIAGLLGVFLAIPLAGVMISLFEINEMKGTD
ncbi:MAG: AI-2E family transporter [Coleofasciculus sp. G3-WIS-01]|uniref:AI-2E family transporter n=1 Tax=Coleofasciculus sp. G3-WIS-01 TaxID=3069528 RepID=UPI0032F63F3A